MPWADFAEQAGIPNGKEFDACLEDERPTERVQQGKKLADRIGIRGTPTIIVNGWKLPTTPSSEDFDEIVENVIRGNSPVEGMEFIVTSPWNR